MPLQEVPETPEPQKIDYRWLKNLFGLCTVIAVGVNLFNGIFPKPVEIAPDKEAPFSQLRKRTEELEIWRAAHEARVAVLKDARDAQVKDLKELVVNQHVETMDELRSLRRAAMLHGLSIEPTVREAKYRMFRWGF